MRDKGSHSHPEAPRRRRGRRVRLVRAVALGAIVSLLAVNAALASEWSVAVVDVTSPANSVTLSPGGTENVNITISVTGKQDGTATFKINRDWTLAGGTFTGTNPQEFTVLPRAAGDPATTLNTTGKITVDCDQSATGPLTLAVGIFGVENSNETGAKLSPTGTASNYRVTVSGSPAPSCAPADTTAPVITYDISGTLGDNGWYKSDVALTWNVSEPESPGSLVKTGCVNQNITADQVATTYSCSATSDGGSAGPVNVTIKRDATQPTLNPSVSPNPALLNGSATASAGADDNLSGIASASCGAVDTSSVGSKSVTCNATDNAGNTNSGSASYSVGYKFVGFSSPVDNGILNVAKAGQAIPLKWRLMDANDAPVTNLTSVGVTVATLSCSSGTTTDEVEEYAAGSSGLQNLGDGYYQFNWKTPTNYANSCKTMNLNLGEGSNRTALFQFRK
jgi:hypothetical protein